MRWPNPIRWIHEKVFGSIQEKSSDSVWNIRMKRLEFIEWIHVMESKVGRAGSSKVTQQDSGRMH